MYKKNCPRCDKVLIYKRKNALIKSINNNSTCLKCRQHRHLPYEKNKKWCNKCKINKSFNKFNKLKNGLQAICRLCGKQIQKLYRENNREKESKRSKEYKNKNPKKVKESLKNYRNNNRDKLIKYDKKYRNENKEKIYAKQKEYAKNNPEKIREKARRRRAKKFAINETYTTKQEQITKDFFNNKCFNCKLTTCLGIDHHKPLSKGNALTLDNAVLLCHSCNSSKGTKDPEDFYGTKKCQQLNKKLIKLALDYSP